MTSIHLTIILNLLTHMVSRFWQTVDPRRFIDFYKSLEPSCPPFFFMVGREGDALRVLVPWILVCQPLLVLSPDQLTVTVVDILNSKESTMTIQTFLYLYWYLIHVTDFTPTFNRCFGVSYLFTNSFLFCVCTPIDLKTIHTEKNIGEL